MPFSYRSTLAIAAAVCALAATPASSRAQQPEPLRLTPPAPHALHFEPLAQGESRLQTAQGELLDVNAKANTLTIKTPTAKMVFSYNDETKITGAQKGITALATMTGSQVLVMFKKDGSSNLATTIEVRK